MPSDRAVYNLGHPMRGFLAKGCRHSSLPWAGPLLLALAAAGIPAWGQGPRPLEKDLLATGPLFVEPRATQPAPAPVQKAALGGEPTPAAPARVPLAQGVTSLRVRGTGAEQRFYTLLTGRESNAVIVFSPEGARLAQIPVANKDAQIVYAADFDVDAAGRVIIADRGANAVKVYDSSGALLSSFAVQAPVSVTALPEGEVAVTNLRSQKLVTIYALRPSPVGGASQWRVVREFGDPVEVTDAAEAGELNRYVNIGRLASDAEGNIYYTFFYLPEPTVRKYDRFGFLLNQFELTTPEFQPSAQSARRAIERLRMQRYNFGASSTGPILRQSVTALGVDPQTQDLWVALGTQLLHFDKDGSRRGTYRTYAPDSQRVEASSILVEPARLIISSDALGAFSFPRPDKQNAAK